MPMKCVSETYFYGGNRPILHHSIARIRPIWANSVHRPLKSSRDGVYAFGLGETNFVERSEREALRRLKLKWDERWVTHVFPHSLEYQRRMTDGIDFRPKTQNDRRKCEVIQPHIEWHSALDHLEQGKVEMTIWDFVDVAALIYLSRLSGHPLWEIHPSNRSKRFLNEHLHDHLLLFRALHMCFTLDDYEQ